MRRPRDSYAILSVCASLLAPMLIGMAVGFTGPMIDTMKNTVTTDDGIPVDIGRSSNLYAFTTSFEGSLFSAMVNLGALVGSLAGGPVAESIGRRKALLSAAPLSMLAYLLIALVSSSWMLILARFIAGLGMGLSSFAGSVYISEVAPTRLRGLLGACNQLTIAFGSVYVYFLGIVARTDAGSLDPLANDDTFCDWRLMAYMCLLPSGGLFLTMFWAPETPRWLATQGRLGEAKRVLSKLRGVPADDDSVMEEILALEKAAEVYVSGDVVGNFAKLKVISTCKRQLVISLSIHILLQFSGLNALSFFQTSVFQNAGLSNKDFMAFMSAIAMMLATIPAVLLVDRLGRRPLLLFGSFGTAVSQFCMGLFFYLNRNGGAADLSWLSVVAAFGFQACNSVGVGTIRWMLVSEIFPDQARGIASSFATSANWLFAFIIVLSLDPAMAATSMYAVFWFFAVFCVVLFVFIAVMVPETKGRTFEDIQAYFRLKSGKSTR